LGQGFSDSVFTEAETVPSLLGKGFQEVRENVTEANRRTVKKANRSQPFGEPSYVTRNPTYPDLSSTNTTYSGKVFYKPWKSFLQRDPTEAKA
jgi:hypothetical protein